MAGCAVTVHSVSSHSLTGHYYSASIATGRRYLLATATQHQMDNQGLGKARSAEWIAYRCERIKQFQGVIEMKVKDLIEVLKKGNQEYEILLEGKNPEYWIEEDSKSKTVTIKGNS